MDILLNNGFILYMMQYFEQNNGNCPHTHTRTLKMDQMFAPPRPPHPSRSQVLVCFPAY